MLSGLFLSKDKGPDSLVWFIKSRNTLCPCETHGAHTSWNLSVCLACSKGIVYKAFVSHKNIYTHICVLSPWYKMYFFSRSRSEKSESYYTKTHKLHLKYIHFSASPCHETSYLDLLCSLLPGLPASGLGPAHCILHTQHSVGRSGRACPETLWFPSAVGIKLRLLITAPS